MSKIWFPYTIRGTENLPEGNFIIASNHKSNLDPFLIGISLKRQVSYFAKDSLFKNPIQGNLLKWGNAFPVKRGKADIGAIKEAIRRLKSVSPLLMFPEGTRKTENESSDPFSGIGFMAVKADVPIVPVYIEGSEKSLPPGAKWFKRHPITITVGKPLYFSKNDEYPVIAQSVMKEIYALGS